MRIFIILFLVAGSLSAQKLKKTPEYNMNGVEIESDLRFLASDELMGRKTGEPGNYVASRYIAEQFRKAGLKTLSGDSYFQSVPFVKTIPPSKGFLRHDSLRMELGEGFVLLAGGGLDLNSAQIVQLPYAYTAEDGSYDDLAQVSVEGKVVLAQMGAPGAETPQAIFAAGRAKRALLKKKGALALIEVYTLSIPWPTIKGFFGGETISLRSPEDNGTKEMAHIWLNMRNAKSFFEQTGNRINIFIPESERKEFSAYNVVGVLEGTDPVLKNEYVALTAHYDHIGFGKSAGRITENDSIFNGARDNAIGTSALLASTRAFASMSTKRSILFIAYTGEEIGLLGSRYYSENPLVPHKNVVFNLNCDGAGYNDTKKITVIGLDRTSEEKLLVETGKLFGLEVINDPVPEQNLFDRSDNVSMAKVGIPSPNMAPGLTAFDAEISKFYHQAADNPESLDFEYVKRFVQTYIHSARGIANGKEKPSWKSGDKYEEAYNALYF